MFTTSRDLANLKREIDALAGVDSQVDVCRDSGGEARRLGPHFIGADLDGGEDVIPLPIRGRLVRDASCDIANCNFRVDYRATLSVSDGTEDGRAIELRPSG